MDARDIFDHPRYRDNPSDLFFELFVVDTIAPIDPELAEWIASASKCSIGEWRATTKRKLTLSDTIEIAILDLWYRNRKIARDQGIELDPQSFSVHFVDHYYDDGSQVDQWAPGALEDAKARVDAYRANERASRNEG